MKNMKRMDAAAIVGRMQLQLPSQEKYETNYAEQLLGEEYETNGNYAAVGVWQIW